MANEVKVKEDGIEFGEGYSLVRAGNSLRFQRRGTILFEMNATGIGLFAAAPVAQQSAYTQTYSTADKTHAALTAADLTDNSGGTVSTTLAAVTGGGAGCENAVKNAVASIAAQTDALLVDLTDLKQLVNSIVDDLQALGLVG